MPDNRAAFALHGAENQCDDKKSMALFSFKGLRTGTFRLFIFAINSKTLYEDIITYKERLKSKKFLKHK